MLKNLLKKLGAWTTVLKWHEPFLYRVRLNGDLPARLFYAFGGGWCGNNGFIDLVRRR